MCGICGFYGFRDDKLLEEMCLAISHRGPDQEGKYCSDKISLGHRRLSIIDLSPQGRQPLSNEDDTIWLTYNGEIYNFQEIKTRLQKKGHIFKSSTDSEVVIHAYEEKGIDCVHDFRGMFAFALWDSKKNKVILCRDRIGKKPLYYWQYGNKLVFASELKSIVRCKDIKREVNLQGFSDYLALQYVPGEKTALKNIYRLPPGHILTFCQGQRDIKKYWELGSNEAESLSGKTESYVSEKLNDILTESLRLRLISDVPLGVLLSGGLDSSSLVSLMAQKTTSIKTFSVGFGDKSDELPYAKEVSKRFHTDHHEFIVKPKNLYERLPKIVWHMDEPIADGGAFATFLVSEIVKEYVKVILVGEGADELFGGYSWHKLSLPVFSLVPGSVKRKLYFYLNTFNLSTFNLNTFNRKKNGQNHAYESFVRRFHTPDLRNKSFFAKMSMYELQNLLPNCLLMKVDKMTMAHSIEARAPFLDHKLLEFVHTLKRDYKVRGLTGKYILRKLMYGRLPEVVLKRRKRGFLIPLDKWMKEGLDNYTKDILFSTSSFTKNVFGEQKINLLFRRAGWLQNMENKILLWRLMIFELWYQGIMSSPNPYSEKI